MKNPSLDFAHHLLESMSDAFFAVDKDWIIIRVNAEHEKKSRIKREDQLGKSLLDVFFSTPETRTTPYWSSYHTVMQERVRAEFEAYYQPLGPAFIIEKLNAKYKSLMGGRDVLGKPILEARPELRGQPFLDLMRQVYETGEPFLAHEMKDVRHHAAAAAAQVGQGGHRDAARTAGAHAGRLSAADGPAHRAHR